METFCPANTFRVNPAAALTEALVRKAQHKGSDGRLDVGALHRPIGWPRMEVDPSRWSWKVRRARRWHRPEHINVLELRASLDALQQVRSVALA